MVTHVSAVRELDLQGRYVLQDLFVRREGRLSVTEEAAEVLQGLSAHC